MLVLQMNRIWLRYSIAESLSSLEHTNIKGNKVARSQQPTRKGEMELGLSELRPLDGVVPYLGTSGLLWASYLAVVDGCRMTTWVAFVTQYSKEAL